MHQIEPFFNWRHLYTAEEDPKSPFYGRTYSEFEFTQVVYNYFIHPQWDDFGSRTLYLKILFTDYDEQYAILELLGEWNDAIENDIMELKREIIDHLSKKGICKFILICENVLTIIVVIKNITRSGMTMCVKKTDGLWHLICRSKPNKILDKKNCTTISSSWK
jgi:hypothetical protein